jgi:hypothetical protein
MKELRRFLVNVCEHFHRCVDLHKPFVCQDTLDAYIDKYSNLVSYLADNATGTPASDPPPPEQTSMAISLQVISPFASGRTDPQHLLLDSGACDF